MKQGMIVFGGTGFFGQVLIQQALKAGFQVTSVSRKGKPTHQASWQKEVRWLAADVFQPEEWLGELEQMTVLVDAIGIIQEQPEKGVTYQRFNEDAARLLAENGKKAKVPLFVYLSAEPFTKRFLQGYFASKQKAEANIQSYYPEALIFRPSLIVGSQRRGTRLALFFRPIIRCFFPRFQPQRVERLASEVLEAIQFACREA
ncbi:NAD(P)H-binding protein [Enterococcus sp. LJL98]